MQSLRAIAYALSMGRCFFNAAREVCLNDERIVVLKINTTSKIIPLVVS